MTDNLSNEYIIATKGKIQSFWSSKIFMSTFSSYTWWSKPTHYFRSLTLFYKDKESFSVFLTTYFSEKLFFWKPNFL